MTMPTHRKPIDRAFERTETALGHNVRNITDDMVTHLVASSIADKNPIAASFPDLVTKAERERVLKDIRSRLRKYGEVSDALPQPSAPNSARLSMPRDGAT